MNARQAAINITKGIIMLKTITMLIVAMLSMLVAVFVKAYEVAVYEVRSFFSTENRRKPDARMNRPPDKASFTNYIKNAIPFDATYLYRRYTVPT